MSDDTKKSTERPDLPSEIKVAIHRYIVGIIVGGSALAVALIGVIGYFLNLSFQQTNLGTDRLFANTDRLIEQVQKELPTRVDRQATMITNQEVKRLMDNHQNALSRLEKESARAEAESDYARKLRETNLKLVEDVTLLEEKTKASVGRMREEVSKLEKQIDSIRFPEVIEADQQRADNLVGMRTDIESLRQELKGLKSCCETRPAIDPTIPVETDEAVLAERIYIRQEPQEAAAPDPKAMRRWVDLTFSVGVRPAEGSSADEALRRIEKVVYKFDKNWFNPSSVEEYDRAGRFRTSRRVWGVTKVSVDVYARGLDRAIELEGWMNLGRTVCFYTSVQSIDCPA